MQRQSTFKNERTNCQSRDLFVIDSDEPALRSAWRKLKGKFSKNLTAWSRTQPKGTNCSYDFIRRLEHLAPQFVSKWHYVTIRHVRRQNIQCNLIDKLANLISGTNEKWTWHGVDATALRKTNQQVFVCKCTCKYHASTLAWYFNKTATVDSLPL